MEEFNIPIDINTNKLLEWLISRRHVNKEWQSNVLKVREKIKNAIQDMPAHEGIVRLLSGQHINYFHCLKIIDILKETEADTKNLFGRYGSQRMKDWQDIVATYQKDNLYLAEAAQILTRNVSYEVPSLRKQIAKCEVTEGDCEKKIKDYSRAENIAQNDFNSTCKQLGITGRSIKRELIELLDDMPVLYKKCAENAKAIQPAIEIYRAFVNFHLGNKSPDVVVLPILAYLVNTGNTTTYEYTYGEKPVTIDLQPLGIVDDTEVRNDSIDFVEDIDFGDNVQIDFGSLDIANKEIDFGISPVSDGDIDWGTVTTDEEFEIVDMDISLEESGIVVEKSGLDGGVATGNDAYTILDNPKTRDQILNDLMELEGFLKMRIYEMSSSSDLLAMTQLDLPTIIQMQTLESITSMQDFVQITLNELTEKRIQHLHNIKHSPKYVDILTGSLKQKLDVIERTRACKKVLEDKILETREQVRSIEPVIKNIIEKTKVLQSEVQDDISKKYKGRIVNIIGAINMM